MIIVLNSIIPLRESTPLNAKYNAKKKWVIAGIAKICRRIISRGELLMHKHIQLYVSSEKTDIKIPKQCIVRNSNNAIPVYFKRER